MKRSSYQPVSIINILLMLTVAVLMLILPMAQAQQTVNKKWDKTYCNTHSGNTSGFSYTMCDLPEPIIVTRTEVREVKVPVPVPGPVRVERVEVPVQPAKKVRD